MFVGTLNAMLRRIWRGETFRTILPHSTPETAFTCPRMTHSHKNGARTKLKETKQIEANVLFDVSIIVDVSCEAINQLQNGVEWVADTIASIKCSHFCFRYIDFWREKKTVQICVGQQNPHIFGRYFFLNALQAIHLLIITITHVAESCTSSVRMPAIDHRATPHQISAHH